MIPLLRWVGKKSKICDIIEAQLPIDYQTEKYIPKYFEPFFGSGSVLFDLLTKKYDIPYIYISDINKDLILLYNIIRSYPEEFIEVSYVFLKEYKDSVDKKLYYYNLRDEYNHNSHDLITKAVSFLFLNKMCYNGLYRINKQGKFNVPYNHKYIKNPQWINEDNIYNLSNGLQNAHILCSDYTTSLNFIDKDSFLYLDIPYIGTWNYNTSENNLKDFYQFLNTCSLKKAKFLLSHLDNDIFLSRLNKDLYIKKINTIHQMNHSTQEEVLIRNYEVI